MLPINRADLNNEVHIWISSLDAFIDSADSLQRILSYEEKQRALNFSSTLHKKAFILSRSLLRYLLSFYTREPANAIILSQDDNGKPFLIRNDHFPSIQFNLSRSYPLVAYAFTHDCNIGIDIEQIRSEIVSEGTASLFLSNKELHQWRLITELSHKEIAFFTAWTKKEAILKAIGTGLLICPKLIEVSITPNEQPCLLNFSNSLGIPGEWILSNLQLRSYYICALALKASRKKICVLELDKNMIQKLIKSHF